MSAERSRAARDRRVRPGNRMVHIDPGTSLELDSALQFLRALWVMTHALQKASKRMARTLGVTGPQRLVIRVVGLSPGLSAGALAKALHLHPSTVTGILQRLEAQRLVSRDRHAHDGRRAVLSLTPAGQRLNVDLEATIEATARIVLARVTPADQRAARDLLERMAEELDAEAAVRAAARPLRSSRSRAAGAVRPSRRRR
jgi:DNA-binding MarR family transcriptional regulator